MRVDGYLSQERVITAGVPQGRVLGLLLFSVYINDLPKLTEAQLSMIADDTAVYAVARNADYAVVRLQRQIDAYVDWADKRRISINASKNIAVVFSRRRKQPRQLRIDRTGLPWSSSEKYSGFIWIAASPGAPTPWP